MIRVHDVVGMICAVSVLVLAGFLVPQGAAAAERAVRLVTPAPLRKDLDAMPQIADPVDDAERRINTALKRLDQNVQKAVKQCKKADWTRTVDAPMTGPVFLSLTVSDQIFCADDAHPNYELYSIVYDLATGRPVDWARLLPASLVGKQVLQEQDDGTKIVTLTSKRLFDLYKEGYTADGATGDDLEECKQTVNDVTADGPPEMMVWLDAKEGGLAAQMDLPAGNGPCLQAVVISAATLRQEGASADLLKAFDRR
jgi:hypothetical protein